MHWCYLCHWDGPTMAASLEYETIWDRLISGAGLCLLVCLVCPVLEIATLLCCGLCARDRNACGSLDSAPVCSQLCLQKACEGCCRTMLFSQRYCMAIYDCLPHHRAWWSTVVHCGLTLQPGTALFQLRSVNPDCIHVCSSVAAGLGCH